MLYKYVKSQPIKIKKKIVSPTFSFRTNRIAYSSAVASFLIGALVLLYSAYPYLQDSFGKISGRTNLSKSVLIPSAGGNPQIAGAQTSSQSSGSYEQNVSKNISSTNKALGIDPTLHPDLSDIKGKMYITIPRLGFTDLPVQLNVTSYDEKQYMPILENNLAHFQGTSLPGYNGNTFIYGHSTNEIWAFAQKSVKVAFTYLDKVEIGDEIVIKYDGKTYKYVLQKTSIVTPDNISPIYTTSNKATLTLMTCWPPGIGADRLILSATQV